jgi:hypothetical protein
LLPLLLLRLRALLLLLRRRLTTSPLHSFSLGTRFIRLSSTGRRRDLLTRSWLCTSARLPAFTRTHGRRRAELYRLILTLWRILWRLTLTWTLLLTGPSRWLTTLLLPLRRRTLQS